MAEMRFVTEVAARRGEVLTHTAVGESSASTAEVARTEASNVSAAAKAADVSAAEATDASATEPTADMSASAEPTGVSTTEAATMSTTTSSAARKRISGQSGGESGSRCEDDHRRT